jgi:hypothetical protein
MGHDTHFLDRLSRVTLGQAELALKLYRDPELVRLLLNEAKAPEGAARLAIALEADAATAPHVVVQRDGHFITCLGPGMGLKDLPVVSRARLDAALGKLGRQRTAQEVLDAYQARSRRGIDVVIERMVEEPLRFCAEDLEVLSAVQPLLAREMMQTSVRYLTLTKTLLLEVERERLKGASRRAVLRDAGELHLGFGNMVAWICSQGAAGLAFLSDFELELWLKGLLVMLGEQALLLPVATRVIWSLGRIGKRALPVLKEMRRRAHWPNSAILVLGGLGALASAHPAHKAEVLKALDKRASGEGQGANVGAFGDFVQRHGQTVLKLLETPPGLRPELSVLAAVQSRASGLAIGAEETLAMTLSLPKPLWCEAEPGWPLVLYQSIWLGRASPAQLLLRRELAQALLPEPEKLDGEVMLEGKDFTPRYGRQVTVVGGPKPGRNDPCGCGSGKKSKRCCAA